MPYSEESSRRVFELIAKEAQSHFARISKSLEYIWSRRPSGDGHIFLSDAEFAAAMDTLINSFGHLALNVFDNGQKRSSENRSQYQVRLDRLKSLRTQSNDLDLSAFEDRSIRNRQINFDEWAAKLILKNPEATIISDLGLSHRGIFTSSPEFVYIRTYIFDEDKILHLGAEFDAKKLYETVLNVSKRAMQDL